MLSVICPIYNEEKYIPQLLNCIDQQDYPKEDLELLFVDGHGQDGSRALIEEFVRHHTYARIIDNPHRIPSYAVNLGVKASKGDYIMRLDAHEFYPSNYFSSLVQLSKETGADNVGCICKTEVLNPSPKSRAICHVLSHPFGVGNSQFRLGVDRLCRVDTVPFGCFPRSTFEKYGLFDTRFVRNQDIEFNHRIIDGGGNIYLTPDTYFIYYARETWQALGKNNYDNGKWNILMVYHTKMFSSLNVRHFIPLIFVLSLIIPTLLALAWRPFILVSACSLLAYTTLVSLISLQLALSKRLNPLYLIITFFVLHLSYGWGSICGFAECLAKRREYHATEKPLR